MVFYTLQHKVSGKHMPSLEGRQRSGYTHEEFTFDYAPRLFRTIRGASNALTLWLRGRYSVKMRTIDTFDGLDTEIEEYTDPVPSRGVREDYEIVPVKVVAEYAGRKLW